jgi:hypothetical protein
MLIFSTSYSPSSATTIVWDHLPPNFTLNQPHPKMGSGGVDMLTKLGSRDLTILSSSEIVPLFWTGKSFDHQGFLLQWLMQMGFKAHGWDQSKLASLLTAAITLLLWTGTE